MIKQIIQYLEYYFCYYVPSRIYLPKEGRWDIKTLTNIRMHLYRKLIKKIGPNTIIGHQCELYNTHNLEIGEKTTIMPQVYINAEDTIKIGNNVFIGPFAKIASYDHLISNKQLTKKNDKIDSKLKIIKAPIIINDNVWIGTGATILKGVTIGKGSIIAAGAVVTKDIPPRSVAAGVPARIIKKI